MKTVCAFAKKKAAKEKIAMVTCYDYTSARIVNASKADCILVGDSLAMTMHGFKDTVNATVEMMALATASVARGAPDKFIIADLPFLANRSTLDKNIEVVRALMQAGAQAVKLEGAAGNLDFIEHLVASGVPVMGHLGLTPQSLNVLGGYKVQGKTEAQAQKIMEDAVLLESAGCFALVLECVPAKLATEITARLKIPTIGIGAGAKTDGQVLVFQDLLGLNTEFKPSFVRHFIDGAGLLAQGIDAYAAAVKSQEFPADENSF